MNNKNQNPGELKGNQVQGQVSDELKTIVAFLKSHRSDDAIESFRDYICENKDLSPVAQIALFGVSLADSKIDLRTCDFSQASLLYRCLGAVGPDDDYEDSEVSDCTEEQFFLRKVAYGIYIISCYRSLSWEFENQLPDGWGDYFDINDYEYDWISYSIDKYEVIQAIESLIKVK